MKRFPFFLGLAALSAGAAAQSFFFRDDFNGTALDPGWGVNNGFEGGAQMTYEVSGGYFRPTGWVTGNNPFFTSGTFSMARQLLPPGQFVGPQNSGFHLTMGFRPPVRPTHLTLNIGIGARDQFGTELAATGGVGLFHISGNSYLASIFVTGSQSSAVTLDPTLDHTLEVIGQGGVVSLLINGQNVLSSAYSPRLINRLSIGFDGDIGASQANAIDYIQIVPEPASAVVFGAAGAAFLARKKK